MATDDETCEMHVENGSVPSHIHYMNQCSFRRIACALAASGLLGLACASDDLDKLNTAAEKGSSTKAAGELAVAIRYLQAKGTSHAHIYLYREDGKLLRQLTRDEKGQDRSPVFAPDGRMIVFTREMPKDEKEFWSVEPLGGGLRKLATAPEWYLATGDSLFFNNFTPKDWPENKPRPGSPAMEGEPPMRYVAPDGSVELVLGEVKGDEDNGVDGPGHGRSYLLRDPKSGKETKMGDIPGFEGLWELLHSSKDPQHFFHFDGALRVAFFGLHLNSTDGDTSYALDLKGPRLVRLAANWAAPFPLPGDGAFLTFTSARYLPIPGSTKTANCSFVERWDSKLKKVRYAKEGSAPICYGASFYRPGKMPAVVTMKSD
jgi:hypothetical protein